MLGLSNKYKSLTISYLRVVALALSALGFFASVQVFAAQLPARIVREYALTSGSARENHGDPRNWRLLASNDDGKHWTLLDTETNQVFRARSQRKVYRVANQEAFNTYRLEIDGTGTLQLAELEF